MVDGILHKCCDHHKLLFKAIAQLFQHTSPVSVLQQGLNHRLDVDVITGALNITPQ